jgi:hypothetical protein
VPCITVSGGIVTSITDRTLTIPTQEVCPSDLCQEGATNGQVLTWNGSTYVPDDIPAQAASRLSEFTFYDAVGASGNNTLASNGLPAPDNTDYSYFRCPFNPTNFAIYCWSVSCENAGSTFGYGIQWSTDLASWTTATGTLNLDNTSSEAVQVTGSLAIGGNPSVVYLRLIYVNLTGNDRTYSIRSLQLSAWN